MRLATSGSVRSRHAHILITDQTHYSLINIRFANACNLPRTRTVEQDVTTSVCAGPVEVPTPNGRYISTFAMVIEATLEPFDVVLGRDWISLCRPVLYSGRVEEASEEIRESLPFGHRWHPGPNMVSVTLGRASSTFEESVYVDNVPERHERFYMSDGTVILRLKDTLYKIHLHFLESYSEFFKSMFTLPIERATEGNIDDDPVRIEAVEPEDFDKMLCLFYPLDVITGDLKTMEDWASVLNVASHLDFSRHRDLAIAKLSGLAPPVERIKLAKQFDVPHWLGPAYKSLCLRDSPLTVEEGYKLGLEDVVKISAVRDVVLKRGISSTQAAALFEATLGERWTL